jgi:hypothetical protein
MRSGTDRRTHSVGARLGAMVAVLVVGTAALAACGDDESAQDDYCAAGEALQSSLASLAELDLVAAGTDGLEAAVGEVRDDLADLRSSASDAVADDVEVLDASIADLDTALSNLGGDITSENATAVGTAIEDVRAAASGVIDTLADC